MRRRIGCFVTNAQGQALVKLGLAIGEWTGYCLSFFKEEHYYDGWYFGFLNDNLTCWSSHKPIGFEHVSFLELVNELIKEKPIMVGDDVVKFTDTGITVGCTSVDKETIKKIYERTFNA